ncbi:MAG: 3-carboxy-cis,cis-muconate cycloisomerase [Pseudomonadota bacterium]
MHNTSPLYAPLLGDAGVQALFSGAAQAKHMVAFERALTAAMARAGLVERAAAGRADAALAAFRPDLAALGAGSLADGVPVPALVRALRAAAPDAEAAAAVHVGATSQDVLDTSLALTLDRLYPLLLARLSDVLDAMRALEARDGAAALMGRTRMQAALPILVGDRLAAWRAPLSDLAAEGPRRRAESARLQFAGPVGTRAPDQVSADMATALGLGHGPGWHTDRRILTRTGAWLSEVSGALGKLGQDVALMAAAGEAALAGGGRSSAMPHKQNPVDAEVLVTLARFNAVQIGGLHQALVHEQERSGAAWTLEWMILPAMAEASGTALTTAARLLGRLTRLGDAAA